jgi:drug/metabolite transporter (DMT)-like permease
VKSQDYKYYLLLHFVVVIWSTTAILGKLISVGSGVLVWYRMGIAVLGIAGYFIVTKKSFRLPRLMLIKTLLVGFLVAAHWVCFFESIKRSNVSIILVCLSLAPFLISFIEPVLFKRRFRPYEGVLGVMSVLGMVSIFTFEYQYVAGIVIGIISVSFSSLFAVINGVFVRNYESRLISFYELLGGFFGVSAYVLIYQRTALGDVAIEWVDLGYLLILGLICTSFAFVVSVEVMRFLTPFSTMMIVNLEPIYGIVLALIIFGEAEFMSLGFYVGAGLIILSIFAHGFLKRRFEPSASG